MIMGNIYCLMGKSASGKDTIYNRLLAMEKLHLRRVVPYTTRPMRSGETDGQTYVFCTEQQVADFEAAGKIIELRAYHTVYGIWKWIGNVRRISPNMRRCAADFWRMRRIFLRKIWKEQGSQSGFRIQIWIRSHRKSLLI